MSCRVILYYIISYHIILCYIILEDGTRYELIRIQLGKEDAITQMIKVSKHHKKIHTHTQIYIYICVYVCIEYIHLVFHKFCFESKVPETITKMMEE